MITQTMWPKGPTRWIEDRTLFVSVPFTWNLPDVRAELLQRDFRWDTARVGGPAVDLLPDYLAGLEHVAVGGEMPGVLQRVNPQATRTTLGCPNKCGFCGIGRGLIEPGGFRELDDWPDLPIICDNNLLAATEAHLERVMARLAVHGWADFNQGLDARLMTPEKARLIAGIGQPLCRMALDAPATDAVATAIEMLRSAGVAKARIRVYCLIGYDSGPDEAWRRCEWVEAQGIKAYPMWFHGLGGLEWNAVTDEQRDLGWDDPERKAIFGWYYQHRRQGSLSKLRRPRRGQKVLNDD